MVAGPFAFGGGGGSHLVVLQKGRPPVEQRPRSSRGGRGFPFLAPCRGHARARRSRSRSPRARWRVDARAGGRRIALSGPVLGGDWGERARVPFNASEISFYSRREAAEISNPFSAERAAPRAATLLVNLARRCSTRARGRVRIDRRSFLPLSGAGVEHGGERADRLTPSADRGRPRAATPRQVRARRSSRRAFH